MQKCLSENFRNVHNGNSIENEYIPPFFGGHMHGLTAGKIQMGYWDPIEKCPPPLPPPHQTKKKG